MNKTPSPSLNANAPTTTGTQPGARIMRQWWVWLVLIALVAGGLYYYLKPSAGNVQQSSGGPGAGGPGGKRGGGASGMRNATPVVVTATAKTGDINVYINGLGAVTPLSTVTVKTHISGELMKVLFTEGQIVKRGQLIAIVDPRPYQVALEQAEGQKAHDLALLQNARVDLVRYQTLFKQDSIQEQQLATQDALVRQDEAQIKIDQAAVDTQKLNLIYCNITSPVNGRIGLRQVDPGNFVQPSDANGLVVITQLQPITVVFSIPEDSIPGVMQKLQAGEKLPVDTFDRSQKTKLASGALLTVDNQIDQTTGMVKLKAQFGNSDYALFPNQFVNSQMLLETKHGMTLIPSAGVQRGSQGTYVYILNADHTISLRLVKVGIIDGDTSAIDEGLAAGENVVTEGADKLRDGMTVEVGDKDAKPATAAAAGSASHPHSGKGHKKDAASAAASASASARGGE